MPDGIITVREVLVSWVHVSADAGSAGTERTDTDGAG